MSAVEALKRPLRPVRDQLRRRSKRAAARVEAARLRRRHHRTDAPVVGEAPVVVSLTSFGTRIDTVAWSIESIARGTVRPRRLVLWLDEEERLRSLPDSLRRLQERGLEVLPTPDYGPHKKYFPYAASLERHDVPLVTADDDILYPRWWLERLLACYARAPHQVSCYRANVIGVEGESLTPYAGWPRCRTTEPSVRHMATGVSGVLYPPALLEDLRRRGTAFTEVSPRADDLWLHWVALQNDVPVGQVAARPVHFMSVPGTQESSLTQFNVKAGGNDAQIARLYRPRDVASIRRRSADPGREEG